MQYIMYVQVSRYFKVSTINVYDIIFKKHETSTHLYNMHNNYAF